MPRTKKRTYLATYAPVDKASWGFQGIHPQALRRYKRRIKAYSDVQAVALANLSEVENIAYRYSSNTPVAIPYKIEKLVEITERLVEL